MARGSSNNVAENRTRSKRGTPTKEIEEKQTSDSIEKKSVVTRRKNIAASTPKVEKKANKKSDKFEADNSSETSFASNKNEELNLANEPVGKKEVLKGNQQNKASKTFGRKRKLENTVNELTEETVGDVESEIVEKKTVKRQNKKLNSDIMDGNSQDSNKSAKSDATKKIGNTKKVKDVIEEHDNEEKNLEINIKADENMANINDSQEKDISTTLDDSSQSSVKSETTRKTRSTRKVEENITVEQNETKDGKSKDKIQNEFEAKADIVSDTSQDTIKPIKGSLARKTRSTKKIDKDIIVEQKETIAVEAYKDNNSDESSVIVDENSQDSVKMKKAISTRKTRSTRTTEESVVELIDKKQKDTEKIKLDYLAIKDKTDTNDVANVDNNDDVSTMPIKSGTRRTRNTKNVDENIVVECEDIKAKEIKEKLICIEKVDTGPDSILKTNKGGSTRKTRSARKAEVNVDVELKDSKAEESKTNIKVDVLDDSSADSTSSNQSGPTRRTRNAKKVKENITSIMQIETEKDIAKVNASDDDSSLDSMNSNLSGTLRKTRSAKKVEEITIEKQNDAIEKNDGNEEKVQLCSTNNNSKDPFDANKDIAAKDDKVEIFIEKNLSEDTDEVLEQITCEEVEEKIEKDEKEIESNYANDNSQDLFVKTKNMGDVEQNKCIDMKIEDSDDKESNSEKCEDDAKNFDLMDNENSKLETRIDQHKNNADPEIANAKSEVGTESKEIEQRNIDEERHEKEAEYYNPTSNIATLCLKDKDSKVNVIDSPESEVLHTCVDDNLAEDKINVEKENDGIAIVEQLKKNVLELNDTTDNFYKNKEDCGKGRMEESNDNDSSKIEKDISLCGMEETTLLENVEEEVLNPETFDENKQSICQTVVKDNQSSNVVIISNKKEFQTNTCGSSEEHKEQATFEDISIQEEKCKEADNIIKTVEIVAGSKTDSISPEELKLKDSKRETGEISIKNSITNISENIDHEDSTTSMIGEIEISEKASADIDVCSDKTEEASVVNFESESSTTDSDTGHLVIADTVDTNTETGISKLVIRTAHDIDDMNQEDISIRITDKENTEMNVTGELSAVIVSETSLNNITGNQQELEVGTVKGAGVTLSEFEMPTTTQIATKDGTESSNKDVYVKSLSQTLAEADILEELKASEIIFKNCKENVLPESSMNSSVLNKETVDNEPKVSLYVKSTVNQISEDNIQTPLTITNAAGSSNDNNFAESCSSSDKIVVDSSHDESNSDEKQKTIKMKKSNKPVKKSSLNVKEIGKKIITTYEVSSNVDSKKGGKRNLAEEGEGSSGTEVSLALKIKRKRVEGVESYDVSPSSLGEHAIPDISEETNIKEQTQKLFADYQSEPGPSGAQQESRRSTRKRKREELDREKSAAPIRMYLEKFVPFLLEGLLKITYVRPEDPIQYLAEWMKENKEAAYSSMNIKDNGDISSDE